MLAQVTSFFAGDPIGGGGIYCVMGFAGAVVRGVWVAGLLSGAAAAQAVPSDAIRAVVHSNRVLPAYQQAVQRYAESYEAGLTTHCKEVALNWAQSQVFLSRPGQMLADGQADGTQWVEKVPGEACGQKRDYRVVVSLHDGKGQMQPMLPGDGWAGALLEQDTMLQVRAAAAAYTGQDCPVDVVDTKLTGARPDLNAKAPWTEVWTVHSCGKHLGVPILFTPDRVGDGTSMSVKQNGVVPLP